MSSESDAGAKPLCLVRSVSPPSEHSSVEESFGYECSCGHRAAWLVFRRHDGTLLELPYVEPGAFNDEHHERAFNALGLWVRHGMRVFADELYLLRGLESREISLEWVEAYIGRESD